MTLQTIIETAFANTQKDFITVGHINELAGRKVTLNDIEHTSFIWTSLVISGHGFLPEHKEKYNKQAEFNIPLIEFGPSGFENHKLGGGNVYCVVRPSFDTSKYFAERDQL